MWRFTNSGDITSAKDIAFKVGNTKRVMLRYTGTNQALQTLATTGLGTVQINRGGKPMVNLNLAEAAKINDLIYGTVLRSSAVGAAIDMTVIIDFSYNKDGNVVPMVDTDYISIPAVSTVTVAALTVTVYQDIADGAFMYVPRIFTRSETLSAEKPIFIPDQNLYMLAFSEPSTPPTKIILAVDGALKFDVPYAVAEITTNADFQIETGTVDLVVLKIASLTQARGHSYDMQMVGGAGTLLYTTIAIDAVPQVNEAVQAQVGARPEQAPPQVRVSPVPGPGVGRNVRVV
jgi:hypothetical protein